MGSRLLVNLTEKICFSKKKKKLINIEQETLVQILLTLKINWYIILMIKSNHYGANVISSTPTLKTPITQ